MPFDLKPRARCLNLYLKIRVRADVNPNDYSWVNNAGHNTDHSKGKPRRLRSRANRPVGAQPMN